MVLKKPYKFFIKYFRLFHLALAIMILYSMVRISNIIMFINNYINSEVALKTISIDDYKSLYNIFDIIIPILAIILSVILFSVMTIKRKPNKFYMYSTLTSVALFTINMRGRSVLYKLTTVWLSNSVLETVADLYIFVIIACVALVAIALARAIGFNISRFDFNSDLLQFELSEEDNAEFEVALNLDVIEIKRNLQKKQRYAKYFLKENKSTITWTIAIIVGFTALFGIYSFSKNRIKSQSISSLTYVNDLGFKVNESYLIDKTPNGDDLPDDLNLIVLDVTLTNYSKRFLKLNPGLISIMADKKLYGRKLKYADYVSDLGTLFYNEDIKGETEERKLFVYAIPKESLRGKKYLSIVNYGSQIFYKLSPKKIETTKDVIKAKLNEKLDFSGSTIGNTSIKISQIDIKDQFIIPYEFKKLKSVETLKPTFTGNHDKVLLKLVGDINVDKNSTSKTIQNVINRYGYIEYVIDGKTYKMTSEINELKTSRVRENNTYYFEVNADILKADKIVLGFRLRNADYKYYLKGNG